jgi:hypothetical protein
VVSDGEDESAASQREESDDDFSIDNATVSRS